MNATTGSIVYRERPGLAGQYGASPVIAGGHLYLLSVRGELTVVQCGDPFQVVHQTHLMTPVSATPAMDRNSLYVRTDEAFLSFRQTDAQRKP